MLEMNQPPSNLMSLRFFSELEGMVSEMKRMNGLEALVISGAGRHFSSGAALDELFSLVDDKESNNPEQAISPMLELLTRNNISFLFFEQAQFPVITAIKGVCLGSAMELALFSHFRFCSEDAVLGLPETTFGLMPGIGGISAISAISGQAIAIELALKGNTFTASEAKDFHLVDALFPKKEVIPAAVEFAKSIMRGYRKEKRPLYLQRINQLMING